jgi:hypothetical protein
MSIVLWTRLEALEKRVAVLEEAAKMAEKHAPPEPASSVASALAQSNATRKAEGERLREEIRRIVGAHSGSQPLSAAAVLCELLSRAGGRSVALRTVQWHLRAIRNTPSIAAQRSGVVSKIVGTR